jgi:hypothetical protein
MRRELRVGRERNRNRGCNQQQRDPLNHRERKLELLGQAELAKTGAAAAGLDTTLGGDEKATRTAIAATISAGRLAGPPVYAITRMAAARISHGSAGSSRSGPKEVCGTAACRCRRSASVMASGYRAPLNSNVGKSIKLQATGCFEDGLHSRTKASDVAISRYAPCDFTILCSMA